MNDMTIVDMTAMTKEQQIKMLQDVISSIPKDQLRGLILSLAYEDKDKDLQVRDYFVGQLATLQALAVSTNASLDAIIGQESTVPPGETIH